MSAAARLAAFALALAVIFVAAAAVGRALGPFERGGGPHDAGSVRVPAALMIEAVGR